jgi:hypothetical protein
MISQMQGKWAGRFIGAAITQGAVVAVITVLIVEPWTYFNIKSYFSPAMVIAGGGGGTWMFTGYVLYLAVGVVAVAVTAVFYFYIEDIMGKRYHGLTSLLAWAHFILMNVGVAGSMLLMIWRVGLRAMRARRSPMMMRPRIAIATAKVTSASPLRFPRRSTRPNVTRLFIFTRAPRLGDSGVVGVITWQHDSHSWERAFPFADGARARVIFHP